MKNLLLLILASACFSAEAAPPMVWSGRLATPAASFTPTDLASLVAWYKVPVPGATNGATFSPWPDSSVGGTFSLSQATSGSRPVYNTNVQNGQDVSTWDGTRSLITGGSSASGTAYTFFAVVNWTSGYSTIFGASSSGGIQVRVEDVTGMVILIKQSTALIGSSTGTIATGTWHTVMATFDNTTYAFYIDGASAGSGSHSTTLAGGTTFIMGYNGSNSGEGFNGQIGESGICNAILSGGDLASLQTYLKNKFGTP